MCVCGGGGLGEGLGDWKDGLLDTVMGTNMGLFVTVMGTNMGLFVTVMGTNMGLFVSHGD